MDFNYTTTVHIQENDLCMMCNRVKAGEDFYDVYADIMSGYDDDDWYASQYVEQDVHTEILRRLGQDC